MTRFIYLSTSMLVAAIDEFIDWLFVILAAGGASDETHSDYATKTQE